MAKYNRKSMKKSLFVLLPILILIGESVVLESCGHAGTDWKKINGTADSILGKDTYDKLIEKYEFVGNYKHGTIVVKNIKYGLLDYNGDELLPCKYDSIYNLENNARIIKSGGKFGIINEQASFIAECKYDSVLSPSPKYAPVMLNKKWGFQKSDGTSYHLNMMTYIIIMIPYSLQSIMANTALQTTTIRPSSNLIAK